MTTTNVLKMDVAQLMVAGTPISIAMITIIVLMILVILFKDVSLLISSVPTLPLANVLIVMPTVDVFIMI
jgi:hypothetical protein